MASPWERDEVVGRNPWEADEVVAPAKTRPSANDSDFARMITGKSKAPAIDPTRGMSTVDKLRAGFGKSIADTGRGLKQAVTDNARRHTSALAQLIDRYGMDAAKQIIHSLDDAVAGSQQEQQAAIDESRSLDAPLMNTGAGLAGNIGGQVTQMVALPGGGVGTLGKFGTAALQGAAFSGAQPMATGESRAAEMGKGAGFGIAGQGVASGTSALARGAISRMEPTAARLAQKADEFGFNFGLPNLSDNQLVRTVASQMERLPFSGAGKRARANQETLNRQVGNTFGAPAKKITPDVFAAAKTRLQDGFETITSRNNLDLSTNHVAQIRTVLDEAQRLGGSDTARMVRGWADELFNKVDAAGQVPGKAYQSFDSRLAKVMKSGGEPAYYLGQLRDVVRAAMDDSISATDRNAWNTLRKQYAALKTVEPLVAKSAAGDISPAALMGRVTADSSAKARMATGKAGALGDLARIGQRFMKEAPNSGTADRMLVNAAVGGGLYGAQHQGFIEPETALYLGGGLLANRIGLKALNSRALASGDSRALNGLARILAPAPRALPALGPRLPALAEITIGGGTVATPEDIARDEEIVRRFRERR